MLRFLTGTKMAIAWTIVRIWLGIQWLEAGYYKIKQQGFDAGGFIQGAIANARGNSPTVQGWYASFLETQVLPNIELFNILIPWGEFLVGLGLIIGLATIPALLAGAFMNINFILAGVGLNSLDTKLFIVAMILVLIGSARSYYGLDRFAVPTIKRLIYKNEVKKEKVSALKSN
ncbi:DoxX family membrane protein [Bacillus nitroreducens]